MSSDNNPKQELGEINRLTDEYMRLSLEERKPIAFLNKTEDLLLTLPTWLIFTWAVLQFYVFYQKTGDVFFWVIDITIIIGFLLICLVILVTGRYRRKLQRVKDRQLQIMWNEIESRYKTYNLKNQKK